MSLLEVLNTRWEFDHLPACPACGAHSCSKRFTTYRTITRNGEGDQVDVTSLGAAPDPHHIVSCNHCGCTWEMECMQ
jgi:hypothetical protein